jgi:hypothetical protein
MGCLRRGDLLDHWLLGGLLLKWFLVVRIGHLDLLGTWWQLRGSHRGSWKLLRYHLKLLLFDMCHIRNLSNDCLLLHLHRFVENLSYLNIENKHHPDILKIDDIVNLSLVDKYGQVHIDLFEEEEFTILIGASIDLNLKISLHKLLIGSHRNLYNASDNFLLEGDNHVILLSIGSR